jgi:translation initiation factor IF-1
VKKGKKLPKVDRLDAQGLTPAEATVISHGKGRMFEVQLDNGHVMLGQMKGKLAQSNRTLVVGDRVEVYWSHYDIQRCQIARIIYDNTRQVAVTE